MHLTLESLQAPGSLEVWWDGWGEDILVETGGPGRRYWMWNSQRVDWEKNRIWSVKINKKKKDVSGLMTSTI